MLFPIWHSVILSQSASLGSTDILDPRHQRTSHSTEALKSWLFLLGEEEQASQNSTNILISLAHQCHHRRLNMAKVSVGPLYGATPFHCRSIWNGMEEVLHCSLDFKISWCISGNALKWSSCCLSLCFFGQHYYIAGQVTMLLLASDL